jgi:opacity protein-like surface antigen
MRKNSKLGLVVVGGLVLLSPNVQALALKEQYVGGSLGIDFNRALDYKVSGGGQGSTVSFESPSNNTISLKYGAELLPSIRADVEVSYSTENTNAYITAKENGNSNEIDVTLSSASLILHGYYDIVSYAGFTPFVGLGFGPKKVSLEISSSSTENGVEKEGDSYNLGATVLAYEVVLGASYKINPNLVADLTYTYGAAKLNGKDTMTQDNGNSQKITATDTLETSSVKVGVRYQF